MQRGLGLLAQRDRLGQFAVQPEQRQVPPSRHEEDDDDGNGRAGRDGPARRPVRRRLAVPIRIDLPVCRRPDIRPDGAVQTGEQDRVVLPHGNGPRDRVDRPVHDLDVAIDAGFTGELPERRFGQANASILPASRSNRPWGNSS